MTIVLGIDTATSGCAVALCRDGERLADARERMARGQSEALLPMINDVMDRSGVDFADIDAIAVTRGPGAFTGLRIGLAAARALALAIARPCLGIITFDILLAQVLETDALESADALVIAVESKREELFIALFNPQGGPIGEAAVLRPEQVGGLLEGCRRVVVAGDGGARVAEALGANFDVRHLHDVDIPDPCVIARIGYNNLNIRDNFPATPLYLRPPDVSLPKA
ncbi:tRNA (adenosine(37)-N6)-threonylcarbamoyltransferase complex dimerization subunit type 1 TsaB [Thalassospiraceae bacterium LMO-JJ14]|nr:tRNA (adenosine(37)-N6)-threonylcarbamoyltransferase complex dimerization subunit type 1 TsaB [Thalassospiraceae bacterium LMO-JJ14]